METDETSDQYFTYDGRLASFKSAHPVARRPSNAKGKNPKALSWPHKQLDPVQFAQAGFFFDPTVEAPDNTVCFLCLKSITGWEENDNPVEEHLRLSPHCGWAIVAAIDAGLGDYAADDPSDTQMVAARKATFGGRWPHDGKRGWKCKTKQLVEAGWKYTPTSESDDMATCTYCSLALDGWEPKDNPLEEHHRRSPNCLFFGLLEQYKNAPKKKGKGKGARASQSSRLSAQSIATTAASDMTSMLDHTIDHEDSVMTTTSVMTQGGTKRSRAKKGTAAKGKKTRAKKEEPIEVLEDAPEEHEEEMPPPPPPKSTRGRKRTSDTIEDSVLTAAEAPAPKKRATRTRKANIADVSVVEQEPSQEIPDTIPAPKSRAKTKKGRTTNTRNTRKNSAASNISIISHQEEDTHMMDDEELNRQLEADLDRPLSDDEDIAAGSDADRKKAPAKPKGKKTAAKKRVSADQDDAPNDHAMFDPEPPQIDEDAVDAELKALETEAEVEQEHTLEVPKKGRKVSTKKASKQTTKKAKEPEHVDEPEPELPQQIEAATDDELAEGHDMSMASNTTIVRTSLASNAAPKKRGRPSKKAAAANVDTNPDELADSEARAESLPPANRPTSSSSVEQLPTTKSKAVHVAIASPPSTDKPLPAPPSESEELEVPSTPKPTISPAPAARQAAVSPSQSPQSSDAENEPPSSKPSNTANSNRIALAPVAVTPVRGSPSKRNVLAGLKSNVPWTAVDVEMIFEELDKENTLTSAKLLKNEAGITSPEKRMTVEEWVYHNAEEAQKKLKQECEAMVTSFEREGTKAMQALEGLVID
ncbi:hypothetical protein M426DRAFT_20924 [Hypoxylon sp. CI-4A]|nr:hypothetical protein M426DRAFT_20924 [Hypoxylon sp. CI-4A]